MSPGTEITHLGVTDLEAEMRGRAQQKILGDVDVFDISTPGYIAPMHDYH